MKLLKIVTNHPTVGAAGAALVLWGLAYGFGIQYDDGGFRGLAFGLTYLLMAPFRWAHDLLQLVVGEREFGGQTLVEVALVFLVCVVIDLMVRKYRIRSRNAGDH